MKISESDIASAGGIPPSPEYAKVQRELIFTPEVWISFTPPGFLLALLPTLNLIVLLTPPYSRLNLEGR